MTHTNFYEKITLVLSFLILSNYLFLNLNFSLILIKINFIIFLFTILVFYFKNFLEKPFLKIFLLCIIFISLGTATFEWDPRSIWLFHAKVMFYGDSVFSLDDSYKFSHIEYPNLAPAFASALAILVGHWNEVFPKISFSLMFLPPLILIFSFFKDVRYLIFLSIVFFTIGKFIFNGWLDGLVAIYFGLSAFLMYLLMINTDNFHKSKSLFYYIAFCFFISLTLLKDEGAALLLILFVTVFLIKIFKGELKKNILKLIFLSFSFLPIILWKLFCYSKGIVNHHINIDLDILIRFYDLDNYKLIAYFIFLNEKFVICLIFFLLSFWINWNKEIFRFILIAVLMYILVLSFIFFTSPYGFYFQLDTAAVRLVRTLNFSLAFFGLYNLNNYRI